MLKVDRHNMTLELVQSEKLADAGYRECEDIQELIAKNPEIFFKEIGESFFLIGKEIQPLKPLGDSIDLLAIDQEGKAVVFELKRGKDKLQLLQSITYAAMVSKWKSEQFFEELGQFTQKPAEEAAQDLEVFLANALANLNKEQRIILIAEEFDPSVIVSAEWLTEQYDLEIECFRLGLSKEGGNDFLSCTRLYPPIELMQFAGPRRVPVDASANWPNWETALAEVSNTALRDFFVTQIQKKQECRLKHRDLIWRINEERRFYVSARNQYAYVWQTRRFDDDINFWNSRLSPDAKVKSVNNECAVRFYLRTPKDFQNFLKAVTVELANTDFHNPSEDSGPETE